MNEEKKYKDFPPSLSLSRSLPFSDFLSLPFVPQLL